MSFLLATTLCALVPLPETPKPKPGIEGTWEIQSIVSLGQATPVPGDSRVISFRNGKAFKTTDGQETETSTYSLDTGNPSTIDVTPMNGGTAALGIYTIAGDELRVCFSLGGERPKEFASTAQSKTILMVFKRVKP
jgi:uncharacterized protein (TIGR03067 family)